jgi:preprotein translocase subunit SecA
MKVDFDYVVDDGKIIIVDPFTGRLMHGRSYSEGLHQAIEAKEGVEIQEETKTLATITFQNLFRMYKKLSGMTGTSKTEEEEFRDIYNMYVISIPTNKPVIREDFGDLIFATQKAKFNAIVNEIKERYEKGQPVLVGTIAVETSELVSTMLHKMGVPHEVLNAKNHAREAEIIAKAGQKGSVTIATNMAGRGTDIKLTDETRALGGLCVLGTERHESRRIDNQLRGRSGRQGDPGFSQFCVSFEDELMIRFGTDRAKEMLKKLGFDEDMSIRNKMLSNSIEAAQKRVEGNNFDIRKQLLQYDDVINQQRLIVYEKRNEILDSDTVHDNILSSFKNYIELLVSSHIAPEGYLTDLDKQEILESINEMTKNQVKLVEVAGFNDKDLIEYLYSKFLEEYENKIQEVPSEVVNEFEKAISLRVIDLHWMEHINTMSHLREGIYLRGYAQEDPLRAYTTEGFELFDDLLYIIDKDTTNYLLRAEIRQNIERKQVAKGEAVTDSNKVKKQAPKKVSKVGRNDPCPCGSGKKYKQCHGK